MRVLQARRDLRLKPTRDATVSPMLKVLSDVLAMIRFSHTLFALPFALASAVLAWRVEPFRWLDLVGILVCMVLARSAAMAFNRLADREYDAENPRTSTRHLPTGRLSAAAVTLFAGCCAFGFFAATFLFVLSNYNWLPIYLSIPVLGFLGAYSLTKRFTALSHFWLGAALMLAPIATWIAICGHFDLTVATLGARDSALIPIILGFAVLSWVAGFDILYACQDEAFDRKAGLHSIPARLGVPRSLRLAMLCHAAMIVLLLLLWWVAGLGVVYVVGVVLVLLLLAYEHWLVRPDDLTRVNLAFFHVNSIISVGLLGIVLIDVWLGG
jgi:4-hydroxybenzoate polyprenyltransferase